MARTRTEIMDLVANVFDRLEDGYPGAEITDAILFVELKDSEKMTIDDGTAKEREVETSSMIMECTSDRVVIHAGLLYLADDLIGAAGDD